MSDHWLEPVLDRFYADKRNFKKHGNAKENAYNQAILEIESHFREMPDVTRLELVDHTPCDACKGKCFVRIEGQEKPVECPKCYGIGCPGRSVVFWDANKQIQLSLQDEGRTLKIFISERQNNG